MDTQIDVDVTWFIEAHLPDVAKVETESFDVPWTQEHFRDFRRAVRNSVGLVALSQERVAGYVLVEIDRTRLRIHNLAVAPWARRSGVATRLIQHLVQHYVTPKRPEILMCVRDANLDAHLWAKATGFVAHTIERGFYGDEDAYVFSLWHGDDAGNR